jgi:O6-methylguanine-DNA--protein-cysteine methyltransferase
VQSAALLGRIFHGKEGNCEKPLSLWVSGSNFQIQVWRALLQERSHGRDGVADNRAAARRAYTGLMVQMALLSAPGLP